jgi:hypothetical protein
MTFQARATANARYEVTDDRQPGQLICLALGRHNADLVVDALNARFGCGEQLEMFDEAEVA